MNLNKITKYLFLSLLVLSFYNSLQSFGKFKDPKAACSQKTLNMYFLAAVAKHNFQHIKFYYDCGANINAINNFSADQWNSFAQQTTYISQEQADFLASPLRQGWSALIIINYSNNFDSIQNAILIIKYLISKGADVNYGFILDSINNPTFVSVFAIHVIRSLDKQNSVIPKILLKSGTKLTKRDIKSLEYTSRNDEDDNRRLIAQEILNYDIHLKLKKEKIKNLKIKCTRKTVQIRNTLSNLPVNLTEEYMEEKQEI